MHRLWMPDAAFCLLFFFCNLAMAFDRGAPGAATWERSISVVSAEWAATWKRRISAAVQAEPSRCDSHLIETHNLRALPSNRRFVMVHS